MLKYTQESIAAALNAIQASQSLRSVAKDYSIPLSTLHDRKHSSKDTRTAYKH